MNDVTRLEQRLAEDALWVAGPPRPVDVEAVFAASIKATLPSKWRLTSMMGVTRLAVAGIIVALFGGFLVAGVVTRPNDATTPAAPALGGRIDLLPGASLEVVEVEPGIFQVLGDGVHDLSVPMSDPRYVFLATGHDGSVWLQSSQWAVPIGREGMLTYPMFTPTLQVSPDGTVWVMGPDPAQADADRSNWRDLPVVLSSFDGGAWTVHPNPVDADIDPTRGPEVDVATDGTVWAAWPLRGGGTRLTRLGTGGWQVLPGTGPDSGLLVTDNDVAWSQENAAYYQDGSWHRDSTHEEAAVGRDGTVWLVWTDPLRLERDRGDGSATCPLRGRPVGFQTFQGLSVAPDGSLWGTYHSRGWDRLARFDCTGWDYPLPDAPVTSLGAMVIADDGLVWVLTSSAVGEETTGSDEALRKLYVITPEAFAGDTP